MKKESCPDLKLSSEQKDKLRKKGSIEQEILEVEEEIEVFETQEPPPIPSDLLDIDMDLINKTPDHAVVSSEIKANDKNENGLSKPSTNVKDVVNKEQEKEALPVTVPPPKEKQAQTLKQSPKEDEEFVVVSVKKNKKR